ncbi:MAG TPA: hypothetical protein VJU80_13670 [Solirubrobacteraceae bacterium]|nr:hypothetical protein [Solirubrobacteraceae bacterium]
MPGAFRLDQGEMAGDRLVFSDAGMTEFPSVWVAGPDTRHHLVFEDRQALKKSSPSFVASARIVAAATLPPDRHGARLFAGPVDGPLEQVGTCDVSLQNEDGSVSTFVASGRRFAYRDRGCGSTDPPGVVVRDGIDGREVARFPVPADQTVDYLSMAGRYVAYRVATPAGDRIVEDDARTGKEVLRVRAPGARVCAGYIRHGLAQPVFCGLDVQSDGKVAEVQGKLNDYQDLCSGTASWLSPAEPRRHVITHDACGETGVSLARDRILLGADVGPISVFRLDGKRYDVYAGTPLEPGVWGFDGKQVFVSRFACLGPAVFSWRVGRDAPTGVRRSLRCPMRFHDAIVRLGDHPRVELDLTCPHGCPGPIAVGTADYIDAGTKMFFVRRGTRRLVLPLDEDADLVRRAKKADRFTLWINHSFSYWERWRPVIDQTEYASDTTRITATVMR